ncbi:MAG: dTDP-4-dehydrorhamnose 3,5-epimerase [Actinomycetota bacterium]|jgi:dTDP-4-dehydrorhamnose 3,5-epimerase
MNPHQLSISGAYVVTHRVFPDERGLFREWFKAEEITSIDRDFAVQQANYSKSNQWVIRGIHYSLAPKGQAKIVTCASGKIVDVLVDLRAGSPSYLKIEYVELSEDSGRVVYIPSGVGHGFIVESETASVVYLTSSGYSPEYEKAICPTDKELGIQWPLPVGEAGIISKADTEAPSLAQARESGTLPSF